MQNKKIFIMISILVALVMVSAVSANNMTEDTISVVGNEEIILDEPLSSTSNESIVLGVTDDGSFTALQNKIDGATSGSTITLTRDYSYSEGNDNLNGITISKPLTINGNGHIIDALSKSELITVRSNVTLNNIQFKNGYSSSLGPLCVSSSGVLSLNHCDFRNCRAVNSGGAVSLYGNGNLNNCNFYDCIASYYGGAVYFYGNYGRLTNCIFENCFSSDDGGAVYWQGIGGILKNSQFTNCHSSGDGGAIEWVGNQGVIDDCDFIRCYANSGGAICLSKSNDLFGRDAVGCRISNSNFDLCSASITGGAIFMSASNPTIYKCKFNETSSQKGGAISFSSSYCNISMSNFFGCFASYDFGNEQNAGGAILFTSDAKNSIISKCGFFDCVAYYAGAVFSGSADGILEYCNFNFCNANLAGGAVATTAVNYQINACNFSDCQSQSGGAIFSASSSNVILSNCHFKNCYSTLAGGAILVYCENASISYSDFFNCTSDFGGAIGLRGEGSVVECCNFEGCSATTSGGSIYCDVDGCRISDCNSSNIHSKYGAVYCGSNDAILNCSEFFYCFSDYGGAVYWKGNRSAVDNCDFHDCSCIYNGGAMYLDGMDLIISKNRFENCSSDRGGAIYLTTNSDNNSIISSSFSHCDADGGIVIFLGSTGIVDNCNFTDCYANVAVFVYMGNKLSNCNFKNCHSNSTSCVLFGGSVMSYCNFDNCKCDSDYCIIFTGDEISYCNFNDCSAEWGGAIYYDEHNGEVNNCNFKNCIASNSAGAIYLPGTNVSVNYCNFEDCSAKYGGAVYCFGGNNVIGYCSFDGCSANTSGGAMYNGVASNCIFKNCNAKYGGAALNISALNCNFTNNQATQGGAMYWGVANEGCIFKSNSANYETSIIKVDLIVSDFKSSYNSGDKLNFDLKIDGNDVDDADIVVKIYENNIWIGDYSFLSGNGWVINLPVGIYDGVFIVKNNGYQLGRADVTLTVTQAITKIAVSSISTVYNVNKNLVITLKDNKGKPISGIALSVNFNGVKNLKTNVKGQVILSTGNLIPKTYNASITFAGNKNYLMSTSSVKVVVAKANLKLSAAKKTFKKNVKTKKYTVTLKNNINKPLKNIKLTLKINGKTFTAKTNANGKATFKITKFNKKAKLKAKISYAGDKYYNKLTKTVQITIK